MKLNWFSPLPPAISGIAGQFTASLYAALHDAVNVTFWTDQAQWDPAVENFGRVRRYVPGQTKWAELTSSDLTIYNMGNNMDFHSTMWEVSQQLPGITILHDERYQHLFAGYYLSIKKNKDQYVAVMEEYYGRSGVQAAKSLLTGAIDAERVAIQYPLTELAMENALAVVIHTPDGFNNLARQCHCPLAYLPLPHRAKSGEALNLWRTTRERRPCCPPYRLLIFGHVGPNRRLEAILKALGGLRRKDDFRLHIYGMIWDENLVCGLIDSCGLSGAVKLHGYVPQQELEAGLTQAHLVLNLRYPSMGEASGTQLIVWDHALPSLVTNTGWYQRLPQSTVVFVRPDCEVEDIQAHLNAFLGDPDAFAAMGERGRTVLLKDHSPEAYVSGLLSLAEEASCYQTRAAALGLADRVAIDIAQWAGATASRELVDDVAQEMCALFYSRAGSDAAV